MTASRSAMFSIIGMLLVMSSAHAAGDVNAGKVKSAACVACHGASGLSTADQWPNLAGQQSAYLVKQLKGFRTGERKDPVMGPIAQTLSDSDIDNLAAFFAAQPAEATDQKGPAK